MALTPDPRDTGAIEDLGGRVARALAGRWPDVVVERMSILDGGASSLTYAATLRDGPAQRVVVKAAPPGLAPVRNRDVLRQAALLGLLASDAAEAVPGPADRRVRVPVVHAQDAGTPPAVPPFFVMSLDPGDSAEPLQIPTDLTPSVVAGRARHAARMLATLHRIDPAASGESPTTPEDEVRRWSRALDTVAPEIIAASVGVRDALLADVPGAQAPALIHGDWRLGNTLCVGAEIRSVIDWEIWSVADPRVDLAWFLMMCDAAHPVAIAGAETGMPSPTELAREYERSWGAPVRRLAWFRALVAYKQAAATALLAKHAARRRVTLEPVTARIGAALPAMFAWAESFLATDTDTGATAAPRRGEPT